MGSSAAAPEFLSVAAARARVLAAARPLPAEPLSLAETAGRALRADVRAPHPLPPFRNSSMDGFALRAAEARQTLRVVETIAAGRPPRRALGPGEAARIMTGAMLPAGADAVLPVEDAELESGGAEVRAPVALRAGQNVREAGRDLESGALALSAGRELSPHDLALLAALGVARIDVGRRPRVAVLSTGDELLDVDAALTPGAIRDSNRLMLGALVEEAGARVTRSARVGDDPQSVARAAREAWPECDMMVTIGGISVGDFDPVRQSLGAIGDVAAWRVAMKPGRPQAFGHREGRLFFGLPGNPASVACVFEVLVRPALRAMQGFSALDRPRLAARASRAIESRVGRQDYVRVRLALRHGEWWATPEGDQVSGHLTPQAWGHALLVIPEAAPGLERGETAEALSLRWPQAGEP